MKMMNIMKNMSGSQIATKKLVLKKGVDMAVPIKDRLVMFHRSWENIITTIWTS